MIERAVVLPVVRNVAIYLVGVSLAVVGALGLADAVTLMPVVAGGLFVVGIAIVIAVHEYFGGLV